jgi:hypothetical protein
VPAGVGLGRFEGRLVDGHTSVLPQGRSPLSATGGWGAVMVRGAFVVRKKSKAPPKRSLDGPPAGSATNRLSSFCSAYCLP